MVKETGNLTNNDDQGNAVVISGLSGTYPESDNVREYIANLLNKVDMVTIDSRRYDVDHPEIPKRSGKINGLEKFDAGFFGIHQRQANTMDSMCRLLMEKTVEAIYDAGLHPIDLENTRTGVFLGVCFSESEKLWFYQNLVSNNFCVTGCMRSIISNRISYWLKLRGPSFILDTACSSSSYAFEHAYRAIKSGQCDNAIVGGSNLCLHPNVTLQFARLGVLSMNGTCKCFDADAQGYVRSEAICVVLLQRAKNSRRIYAKVLHAKTNCDGYKEQGITYPSGPMQQQLLEEFYSEVKVDPLALSFIEAHGTGTRVGDPEEIHSLDKVFCNGRKTPLLIGSVKCNIGHTEPVSGLCSISKVILAMECGIIPPNIHYKSPRAGATALEEGRMVVVTEKTPFTDRNVLVGVNSFGFGGGNCHVLLEWNDKKKIKNSEPEDNVPRLICVSGRVEEAVTTIFNDVLSRPLDFEFVGLLHSIFTHNTPTHKYRGYSIVAKSGELSRKVKKYQDGPLKQLCFVFSGFANWSKISNEWFALPAFRATLKKIDTVLLTKGVNFKDILLDIIEHVQVTIYKQLIVFGALQICLVDVFKSLNIFPEVTFGVSDGAFIAAYCDGNLTLEQTIVCIHILGNALNDHFQNNKSKTLNLKETVPQIRTQLLFEFSEIIKNISILEKLLDNLLEISSTKARFAKTDKVVVEIGNAETELCLGPNQLQNGPLSLLQLLGELYVNGFAIDLQNLYPKINYPVSRGTPTISPLIKWNHSEDWFVAFYEPEGEIKSGESSYCINIREADWNYLSGHVIDGRNLFPATGYLYLVWETVAMMNERLIQDTPIVFENVKFLRATTIPANNSSIELAVMVQRNSGHFEVAEGGGTVVSGRVYVPDDISTEITLLPIVPPTENYLPLIEKDVYKELKLRGYQYSGAFRAIKQCENSAEKGIVEWSDNFVAFMDNMLQLQILLTDTRSLYVPTGIEKLVIDPQMHLNCAKKLGSENPKIPVYISKEAVSIRSGGIQVVGLAASAIARRKQTADPVLEKYVFVPNEIDNLTIQESVRINMQIILENIGGTKVKVYEVVDEIALGASNEVIGGVIFDVLADQPLIQPDITILTRKQINEISNVTVQEGFLPKEKDAILVIGTKILSRTVLQQQSFEAIKDNGFILSREAKDFQNFNYQSNGIEVVTVHKTDTETLILFRKSGKEPTPVVINLEDTTEFSWLVPLQENLGTGAPVVVYVQNAPQSGILGFVNCLRREPTGKRLTCFFLIGPAPKFDLNAEFYQKQYRKGLAINIFKNGKWGSYRHLLLEKEITVEREHCYVNTILRGDLSALKWIEGNLNGKQGDVEPEKDFIHIYYSSLNFRDVMTASGRIDVDAVTKDRFKQECVQGFEFCGRNSKGKRIMGMATSAALATELVADSHLIVEIPEKMSMEEAATIPVVYCTAIYAFCIRGGLKPGQSVLIHAGTGGVGQAAIHIALYYKCNIFTTVGTKEKRDFIKKHFPQIPDNHIGNSRDTSFEQMVMRGTKGRGVDYVLNSLAEEKLLASIRCLAPGGSFLEIGKFDLAKNTPLNLQLMKREASFHGIMIDSFTDSFVKHKVELMKHLRIALKNGSVKPLSRIVFNIDEVEKAFRFMGAGKHMGKVIIKIREEEKERKLLLPEFKLFKGIPRYFCDSESSYIITGGLGGFGLELADWLILRGARKLVLTSRHGIKTGYQAFRIRIFRSYGAIIYISTADITTESGCITLLEEANNLGPIKAIFNLAVVLRDAIIENQDVTKYIESFGPKAIAVTHLDRLTRSLCPDLTDFVVFSSVSCGRGNAGQTNYGMANSVMERICEQRKLDGYPALAIQWGAIGEVGLVAEMQEQQTEIEIGGTLQQRISSCLSVMDTFLRQNGPIVSSMVVAEKRSTGVANNVVDCVANIMGIKNLKTVSHQSTLAELGMDSMMAVEIKQTLEREFEVFLTAQDIRNLTFKGLYEIKSEGDQKGEITKNVEGTQLQLQLQFIGDEALANERIVELKSLRDEPTVYMVPGIEGMAPVLNDLAKMIKGRVCCLQNDFKADTIEIMGQYIYESIKNQNAKSNTLILVAYSYGCIITLEALALLEKDGYVGHVILIDGAVDMLKHVIIQQLGDYTELAIFETTVLSAIISQFKPLDVITKQREKLLSCHNFEERLNLIAVHIDDVEQHSRHYLKRVVEVFYKRVLALAKYTPKITELKSTVELLRPEIQSVHNVSEDYNISKIVGRSVNVKWFKGNHVSIRESVEVAEYINERLEKIKS